MIYRVTVDFEINASSPDDAVAMIFRRLKDSDFEVPPVAVNIEQKEMGLDGERLN